MHSLFKHTSTIVNSLHHVTLQLPCTTTPRDGVGKVFNMTEIECCTSQAIEEDVLMPHNLNLLTQSS
jgi:hypothetical protein